MIVDFCEGLIYLKDNKLKDLRGYSPSLSLMKYQDNLLHLSAVIARFVNLGYNEEILA